MLVNSSSVEARLFSTLDELLKTTDYKNILIRDIINASGVSRQSFYKRFSNKFNLATAYVFNLMLNIEPLIVENTTVREVYCLMLTVVKSRATQFAHLYTDEEGSSVTSAALDMLYHRWHRPSKPTWVQTMVCTHIIKDWISCKFTKSVKDVCSEILNFMPVCDFMSGKELSSCIERYSSKRVKDLYQI